MLNNSGRSVHARRDVELGSDELPWAGDGGNGGLQRHVVHDFRFARIRASLGVRPARVARGAAVRAVEAAVRTAQAAARAAGVAAAAAAAPPQETTRAARAAAEGPQMPVPRTPRGPATTRARVAAGPTRRPTRAPAAAPRTAASTRGGETAAVRTPEAWTPASTRAFALQLRPARRPRRVAAPFAVRRVRSVVRRRASLPRPETRRPPSFQSTRLRVSRATAGLAPLRSSRAAAAPSSAHSSAETGGVVGVEVMASETRLFPQAGDSPLHDAAGREHIP